MNPSHNVLKVIVIIHFVLSMWAMGIGWLPSGYLYLHAFLLAMGMWSMIDRESSDPVLMFLVVLGISAVQDIIFLAVYEPIGRATFEPTGSRDLYRFSLGMCITNLLVKPVSGFFLLRILQSRSNDYGDFHIPGVGNIPGFGGTPSAYENIDRQPPAPYNPVETASDHHDPLEKGP